jgi:hypothetical protein
MSNEISPDELAQVEEIRRLYDRAKEAGTFTLNEIRDHFSPHVSSARAIEIGHRVHDSVQDLSEAERVAALIFALMTELI